MNRGGDKETEIVIYVGTRKLVALIGEVGNGEPRILRHAELVNPDGFENGLVTNLERASCSLEALVDSLFSAKDTYGVDSPRRNVSDVFTYAVLGNAKLKTYHFSSSQYFQGLRRSISSHEIRSVVAQTRSVATLPLSEFVLQSIPESFLVDDTANVANPLGLEAHRLGVTLKIFTMDFQAFRNISKAFEAAEIEVKGYFPRTLTASEAVLTENEKEEGSLVIDIADDVTHLVLWKNSNLVNTKACGFGGRYLTNQIAKEWEIEIHDAAKVKEQFASLQLASEFGDELVPLIDRNGKSNYQIKRQEFQEKFLHHAKRWMKEILEEGEAFAREEKILHPHLIFTGGGTRLDGFLEFLQKQFAKEARIGCARKVEAPNELLVDPSLSGLLGMFRWLATHAREQERLLEQRGLFEKTFASARDWFSAYF